MGQQDAVWLAHVRVWWHWRLYPKFNFSASGTSLAWGSHESTMSIVDASVFRFQSENRVPATFRYLIVSENSVVLTAGHDCYPGL